jgi:hypothetical protein
VAVAEAEIGLAALPRRRVRGVKAIALAAVLGVTSIAGLGAALWFVTPQITAYPEVVTVPLTDVPEVEPLFLRPFDMGVSAHGLPLGIWLVRDGDQVLALYSRDAHLRVCAIERLPSSASSATDGWFISGSVPTVSEQRWRQCPSWRWSRTGVAVFGGARDMDRFDTVSAGDIVRIDVSRLRIGNCGASVRYVGGCPYSTDERPIYVETRWPRIPQAPRR